MVLGASEEELVADTEGLPHETKVEINKRETIKLAFFFINILSGNNIYLNYIAKVVRTARLIFTIYFS